jgi:hypothetical protein
MSFQSFLASIKSNKLRAVACHWHDARGNNDTPSFSALRPRVLAKQLPIIWCYQYDDTRSEFVGRLAGEAIARAFDCPFKDSPMSELQKNHGHDRFADRARRVASESLGFRGTGLMFQQQERYAVGERIILPISNDTGEVDSILGATDHNFEGFLSSSAMPTDEAEEWFSLGL